MCESRRFFHVTSHECQFFRSRQVFDNNDDDDAMLLICSFCIWLKRLKIAVLLLFFLKRCHMLMNLHVVRDMSLQLSEICLHALHDCVLVEVFDDWSDHDNDESRSREKSRRSESCWIMTRMNRRCQEDWSSCRREVNYDRERLMFRVNLNMKFVQTWKFDERKELKAKQRVNEHFISSTRSE